MEDAIVRTVELKAPVSRVWKAVTDHEQFGEWFRVKLDGPFAVGELSHGWITYPGYEHVEWNVWVRAIEPERRLRLFVVPLHGRSGSGERGRSSRPSWSSRSSRSETERG